MQLLGGKGGGVFQDDQIFLPMHHLAAMGLHRDVANAIVNRDAEAARSAMFQLVQHARGALDLIFQEDLADNEAHYQGVVR